VALTVTIQQTTVQSVDEKYSNCWSIVRQCHYISTPPYSRLIGQFLSVNFLSSLRHPQSNVRLVHNSTSVDVHHLVCSHDRSLPFSELSLVGLALDVVD